MRRQCKGLNRADEIACIGLAEAIRRGYTPCSVCVCVPVELEYALDARGGLLSRFGQRPAGSAVGMITIHSQCT